MRIIIQNTVLEIQLEKISEDVVEIKGWIRSSVSNCAEFLCSQWSCLGFTPVNVRAESGPKTILQRLQIQTKRYLLKDKRQEVLKC